MTPEEFSEITRQFVRRSQRGYWWFSPPPLESSMEFPGSLISILSTADRVVSKLSTIAESLPNPHILIAPFLRREAVLSSRIEGTQASLSDLFFFEASGISNKADVQEVANYVTALEYGLARLSSLPISGRLLREMHERLLSGIQAQHLTPGEFRTSQNWIGSPGSSLDNAKFVPPPPDEMRQAISQLEKFIHAPSDLPPLIKIALVHYQFEAIHPFLDGNGRIGRLLIGLMLRDLGLMSQPLLYISAYFEKNRSEYYERLMGVSLRGEWTQWIKYFLNAVATQSIDATERCKRLLDLQQDFRSRLRDASAPNSVLDLADYLFTAPAVTTARAAKHLNMTVRTARLAIMKLQSLEILTEVTGRMRGRIFVAQDITKILEA